MDSDRAQPQFAVVVRGYDRHQVDDYVGRLLEYLEEAEQRTRAAEQRAGTPAPPADSPTPAANGLATPRGTVPTVTSSSVGEHAAAVLQSEERAARLRQVVEELLQRSRRHAEDQAETILRQARTDADRMLASTRDDIERGQVNQVRAERDRLVAELSTLLDRMRDALHRDEPEQAADPEPASETTDALPRPAAAGAA